ncbi:hypothetical protein BDF20DRAFT_832874 [Mycotypha africana]|uniref:uncharacterized protein n=1 Tax=Mycotypha africana TaxID=64632 RepID=UPI002300B0C7|nr:uncharacterized protein BDF20DRAFT_832874 [Mycotypha africana]KAI8987990.1 hypothetical protein BDF20DRAFT_832874 [Mycotypha africana]
MARMTDFGRAAFRKTLKHSSSNSQSVVGVVDPTMLRTDHPLHQTSDSNNNNNNNNNSSRNIKHRHQLNQYHHDQQQGLYHGSNITTNVTELNKNYTCISTPCTDDDAAATAAASVVFPLDGRFAQARSTPIIYSNSTQLTSSFTQSSSSSSASSLPSLSKRMADDDDDDDDDDEQQRYLPTRSAITTTVAVEEKDEGRSICSAHSYPAVVAAAAATVAARNTQTSELMRSDALTPQGGYCSSSSSKRNPTFHFSTTPTSAHVERGILPPLSDALPYQPSYFSIQRFYSKKRWQQSSLKKNHAQEPSLFAMATPQSSRWTTSFFFRKRNPSSPKNVLATDSYNDETDRIVPCDGDGGNNPMKQQFPDFETRAFCEVCEKYTPTRIRYRNGVMVWLMAFIM